MEFAIGKGFSAFGGFCASKSLDLSNFVVWFGQSCLLLLSHRWLERKEVYGSMTCGYAKIFDIFTEFKCSTDSIPRIANQVVDCLAKRRSKQLVSFVGDDLPS